MTRALTFLILLSVIAIGCSKYDPAESVSVVVQNFRPVLDNSQTVRRDIDLALSVENNGKGSLTYDAVTAEFYLQDNKCCEVTNKLTKPVTIKPFEHREETVRGNFGLCDPHQPGREVMVSLWSGDQVVRGPVAIFVPLDMGN